MKYNIRHTVYPMGYTYDFSAFCCVLVTIKLGRKFYGYGYNGPGQKQTSKKQNKEHMFCTTEPKSISLIDNKVYQLCGLEEKLMSCDTVRSSVPLSFPLLTIYVDLLCRIIYGILALLLIIPAELIRCWAVCRPSVVRLSTFSQN